MWCHTPIVSAPGRLRQKDHKFKVSLGHSETLPEKNKEIRKK
jgi:hypothetical protein